MKLEVGSGNFPQDGYEHLDIDPNKLHLEYVAPMDSIPVEDETFEEVLSIHSIEHQPWRNTLKTLTEWVRVLKTDGMIRIATPNLRWICQSYIEARAGNPGAFQQDANIMTGPQKDHLADRNGNIDVSYWTNFKIMSSGGGHDQHYACFDAPMLCDLLMKAGCCRTEVEADNDSLVVKGWK
jgi:hypothetical protein